MAEYRFALKSTLMLEDEGDQDETVLIDSHSGAMWICNETAGALLHRLIKGATTEQLVDAVTSRYAVSRDVAKRDVDRLLDGLSAAGLLASTAARGKTQSTA